MHVLILQLFPDSTHNHTMLHPLSSWTIPCHIEDSHLGTLHKDWLHILSPVSGSMQLPLYQGGIPSHATQRKVTTWGLFLWTLYPHTDQFQLHVSLGTYSSPTPLWFFQSLLRYQLFCMTFVKGYMYKCLFTSDKPPMSKVMIIFMFCLVSQWVSWGYLKEYWWRIIYRSLDNIKAASCITKQLTPNWVILHKSYTPEAPVITYSRSRSRRVLCP